MRDLNYELKQLCRRNRDGSYATRRDRERVLRRFVRLEASRSAPGAGLGLSLVSAIARLHNATIALDDANPGLRVTLSFPLPALAVRALAPRAPHAPSEATPIPPPRK